MSLRLFNIQKNKKYNSIQVRKEKSVPHIFVTYIYKTNNKTTNKKKNKLQINEKKLIIKIKKYRKIDKKFLILSNSFSKTKFSFF